MNVTQKRQNALSVWYERLVFIIAGLIFLSIFFILYKNLTFEVAILFLF